MNLPCCVFFLHKPHVVWGIVSAPFESFGVGDIEGLTETILNSLNVQIDHQFICSRCIYYGCAWFQFSSHFTKKEGLVCIPDFLNI